MEVCSMMEVRNQDVLTGQLQPRLNYQLQHQQQHTQVPYLYDHSHHHVQTSANYQQSITRSTTTGEGDPNLQTTYQTRWYPARSADCDHSDPAEYTTDLTDRNQQPTRYTSNYHYEQNVSFYTNPASDYHSCNTTNIYYHRANDKDWQQTAPNSDPYCQTSYGPSYYDYHHQQQQQTAPSTSSQNQQENIQFSYNHAKYYPTEPYHAQTFPQPPCQLVEQQKPVNPDQGQSRTCLETGSRYLADGQQEAAKPQEQPCWTRLTGSSDDLDSRCSNAPNTSLANASVVRSDNQQAWPTQNDSLSIKKESEQRHNHSTLQPQSLRQKRQRISKNYTTDAPARTNYCRVCGRNYARPSTLKTHLRTHTNERPFKCDVCLKTFSQAANLTAHQRVHTGERPFSCPICDRQFSQSSSVITHLRTHSGERPYRCNMCSRTFSDSSTLTKHCRIHSGEKPYQCDHCPLNFSQSGNLSRHLRLHQINSGANSVGSSASSSSSSSSAGPSSSRPHLSNDLSKTQTVKYDE